MNFLELTRISFDQLRVHKLRSFLTLLGIVFGIAAVISMLSIGEGAKAEIMQQIRMLGLNNIIIKALSLTASQQEEAKLSYAQGLRVADSQRIAHVCRLVRKITPLKQMDSDITFPRRRLNARVIGTTPEYFTLLNVAVNKGRQFNEVDIKGYKQVCVIGAAIKKELFGLSDSLHREIVFNHSTFEVVGELADRSAPQDTRNEKVKGAAIPLDDINLDIYIPLATISAKTVTVSDADKLTGILVQVEREDDVMPAADMIRNILDQAHRNVKDYQLTVPQELLRQSQAAQRTFNIVLGCIAAISLLVGGIGIMNIMLATVLERTREIGLRRAVSATRGDIVRQFLTETSSLSAIGGLCGIILGLVATRIIVAYSGWKTVVSPGIILVSFSVAVTIGITFGLYPAWKAAKLDPVASLRYE